MHVIERLRRSGIGVDPSATVKSVAGVMERAGVGAIVVIDDGRPVGIVTDRDLVRRAMATGMPADARIDAVMSTDLVTVDADADVHDAFALIRRNGVRRLPVLRDGRFVGMVTLDDLLVEVTADLAALTRTVAIELHHSDRDSQPPVSV